MRKESQKSPVLNPRERQVLKNWLYLDDWHFEVLFLGHCIEMSSFCIRRKDEWEIAKVYGLKAIYPDSKRSCIANIFIRYEYKVYRVHDIEQAGTLIRLLRKEVDYEEYMERQRKKRFEERKKGKMAIKELKAA